MSLFSNMSLFSLLIYAKCLACCNYFTNISLGYDGCSVLSVKFRATLPVTETGQYFSALADRCRLLLLGPRDGSSTCGLLKREPRVCRCFTRAGMAPSAGTVSMPAHCVMGTEPLGACRRASLWECFLPLQGEARGRQGLRCSFQTALEPGRPRSKPGLVTHPLTCLIVPSTAAPRGRGRGRR